MKRSGRQTCYLAFGVMVLSLLSEPIPAMAEEPSLARLAFWVPPERMEEFGATYAEQVVPVLKKHGFKASSERGRVTVDSVFSRLFAFAALDTFFAQRQALFDDPAWTDLRERLGSDFGAAGPDSPIRCQLVPYRCPAIPDRSVTAGSGTRRGAWRSFGVQDGLPAPVVHSILPTPDGHLWFTGRAHITRYDGESFVTYTTSEYRIDLYLALLQARDGNLWFNGLGGLARYDGKTFATYTAADGLAGDDPMCLLQDREGDLWIGDEAGVTRYDGETFRIFTDQDGLAITWVSSILEDSDGILWFGRGVRGVGGREHSEARGVARYDGKTFRTWTGRDRIVDHAVFSIMQDRHGALWFGGENQVTRYDGDGSSTLDTGDGLVEGWIMSIHEDRDGDLWFGSPPGGISRFDGRTFTTFTAESGLANNQVYDLVEDGEGYLWVSTRGGLSRYEGTHWTTFTLRDGLPSPYVFTVLQDRTGAMWFGTASGLVRYDGEELETFTAEDGMAEDQANWVVEGLDGHLWIKGFHGTRGTRYDGKTFTPFTLGDSLDIGLQGPPAVDREGHVWFPTHCCGVVRYDGHDFSILTRDDGLLSDQASVAVDQSGNVLFGTPEGISRYGGETITPVVLFAGSGFSGGWMLEDRQGRLWIGNLEGEVARYDGNGLEILTVEDGLKPGIARPALEDRRGHIWIGIHGAGIVRTDGLVFQDLHQGDGLVSDAVQSIMEDRDGDFWISTDGGITRYRPSAMPPAVRLKEVVADRSYGAPRELALPSSQDLIQFTFQGRSFVTPPDRMAYVYRLQGYEEEWQTTRRTEVRYPDLPIGDYVFQVKAVDRDLNYSVEPATARIIVHPPYGQIALWGALGLALVGLAIASGYGVRRSRERNRAQRERDQAREQLVQELEEELQTAHDMQMSLMPEKPPRIPGLDIAGRCLPANHVGGDFFQYFPQDGKLSACMADVTGHAMEAAIPVVMFNGILESQMELGGSLEELFARLNRSMHRTRVDNRTFVCFTMGELDLYRSTLQLANGGCPYPYHFRAATSEVAELQVDAYPLGVSPQSDYKVMEVTLEPGDRVVFCSDGIIEAESTEGEIFSFERTAETIRQACAEDLSAEALIDRLIGAVKDFAGEMPQGDDMTVVVLKVEK